VGVCAVSFQINAAVAIDWSGLEWGCDGNCSADAGKNSDPLASKISPPETRTNAAETRVAMIAGRCGHHRDAMRWNGMNPR